MPHAAPSTPRQLLRLGYFRGGHLSGYLVALGKAPIDAAPPQ
jgi:hypothetical protein